MTKREKMECSAPGCHTKRMVNIQIFKEDAIEEIYFCDKHFLEYIGYMSIHFSKNGYKEEIFNGISLYK